MMKPPSPLKAGLSAAKANLKPGIVLWGFALLILISYYGLPVTRPAFDAIGELKNRFGYAFSLISTAIFAGLIPALYAQKVKRKPNRNFYPLLTFCVFYWGIRGMEVDLLYRLQAIMFGNDNQVATIAEKVFFDQFVYNPFWVAPSTTLIYLWKDMEFSWSKTQARLTRRFFVHSTLTILISTWFIWIPAVIIIYSLPLPLQIPLFNLVLCFFVMLLTYLTSHNNAASTP